MADLFTTLFHHLTLALGHLFGLLGKLLTPENILNAILAVALLMIILHKAVLPAVVSARLGRTFPIHNTVHDGPYYTFSSRNAHGFGVLHSR